MILPGLFHPALAEPRTKEEWRLNLNAPAPVRPSLDGYDTLTGDQLDQLDDDRHAWHSALILIRTPAVRHIHTEIEIKLLANRNQPPSARRSVVLDGPPTVGKSTLVKMFGIDLERKLHRRYPDRFTASGVVDGYAVDYTPVVYISVPSQATPKDLSAAFAEWFNLPIKYRTTKRQITDQVLKTLRLCGTELVIIDDVHFLDLSAKEGQVVNDHLKYLANYCSATFVHTGVNLEDSGLFLEGGNSERASQTAGRNSLYRIEPFKIGTDDEIRSWANVIKSLEDAVVLLDHPAGSLVNDYQYLHQRTDGSIASLSALIREGAIRAVLTREERITRDILDSVVLDRRATRAYQRINPGPEPGGHSQIGATA